MSAAPKHRRLKSTIEREQRQAQRRELSASERGYDWQWKKVADLVRERDEQLCQDCLDEGGIGLAMETLMNATEAHPVDHVIPAHVRPDLFYDLDNLRTRCPKHHSVKTKEDLKKWGAAKR